MPAEENRLRRKVLYLTERDFLSCFESVDTGFPRLREPGSVNQLQRVRLVGVPADCTISRFWYDHARMAVGILLHHGSFEELPVGADPEVVFVERTLYQCDHEGRSIGVRDTATYERLDGAVDNEGAEPESPGPTRYTYVWRNKFLCLEAGSFDEFLGTLEAAVQTLQDWKARGVRLETAYGIRDDYAEFYTEDPALARELGFVAEPTDDDDEPLPLSEREATPGEAAVCEQIDQAHRGNRSLTDIIEEMRNPKPPAEPVPFDGTIKNESWRDRPSLF